MNSLALLLAQAGDQAATPSLLIQFAPFVVIILIFYFFLIRPQRQRQKAHEAMLSALQPGDKIVTNGGLLGTIVRVEDKTLKVKLATSVEVSVLRSHVAGKADEEAKS